MMSRRSWSLVLGLTTCLGLCGCATLDIPWVKQTPKASARNPVVQILCMWEPSEGRDPNGAPSRGFAGQILFLGNRGGTPVAVDGDVSVYVFDDVGSDEEQTRPVHQFNFDAGAWNQHMKVGTLGPAYHCFIPYTRPGGFQANCTLRLKYAPKSGAAGMTSDASHIALKGKARSDEPKVQVASRKPLVYETSQPLERAPVRTTTISMQPTPSSPRAGSDIQQAGYFTQSHEEFDPTLAVEQRAQQVLDEFRRQQAAARLSGSSSDTPKESPRLRMNTQTLRATAVAGEPEPLELDDDDLDIRAEEMIRNFTGDQRTTSS